MTTARRTNSPRKWGRRNTQPAGGAAFYSAVGGNFAIPVHVRTNKSDALKAAGPPNRGRAGFRFAVSASLDRDPRQVNHPAAGPSLSNSRSDLRLSPAKRDIGSPLP